MATKVLICGNAPTLPEELKGVNLDRFDKVTRSNHWHPIPGYDNRCDIHVISVNQQIMDRVKHHRNRDYWVPYVSNPAIMIGYVGKPAQWMITKWERLLSRMQIGCRYPTTGALTIWKAVRLGWDVTIAGFTFFNEHYKSEDKEDIHYFKEQEWVKPMKETRHEPSKEKKWVNKLVKKGKVKWLKF